MKEFFKDLLTRATKNDFFWSILKPISNVGMTLVHARESHLVENNILKVNFNSLTESLTVLNGPFKGLKYPSIDSVGSAIYPKLIGSYERELHPTIKSIENEKYSEIIDIGCAEGYYAIGMARNYNNAKIYAFDMDSRARKLCSDMAELNGVADRVEIHSECTPDFLRTFNFSKKGLIISDCEGFESELFTPENIVNLQKCDLIIETHDFINLNISTKLKVLFSKTHDIESIYSVDDIHKALNYGFSELSNMTLYNKKRILSERRPAIMEWLFCRPKKDI